MDEKLAPSRLLSFRLRDVHLHELASDCGVVHGIDASIRLISSGEGEEGEAPAGVEEVLDSAVLLHQLLERLVLHRLADIVYEDFPSFLVPVPWILLAEGRDVLGGCGEVLHGALCQLLLGVLWVNGLPGTLLRASPAVPPVSDWPAQPDFQ